MTNLERLRSRADNSGLSVETVVRGGSWFMSVDVQSPFAFHATSGWQPTRELAAKTILDQLRQIGEQLPEE